MTDDRKRLRSGSDSTPKRIRESVPAQQPIVSPHKRVQHIIDTSVTLKRRYGNQVDLRVAKRDHGHASTGGRDENTRVTVNESWASGVTDGRLKATLYHESVHTKQRKRPGFMDDSTKAQREFHAHTEELRKAMKHKLFTPDETNTKKKKIKKYYDLVKTEQKKAGLENKGVFKLIDDQYRRIEEKDSPRPSKITTRQLHRAIIEAKRG